MENSDLIRDILVQIEAEDPSSFERFASEHPLCFQKDKGDWLFPMLYDFYSKDVCNEKIINLLQQLGMHLHKDCISNPLNEIVRINKALCIDDSYVEDYVRRTQSAESDEYKFKDLHSPYKTKGISLALKQIPRFVLNSIIFEYKEYDHPYILADIAAMFVYGNQITEGIEFLYRSVKQIIAFPNRYWNSDYGIAGAANTFRLLLLMCPDELKLTLYGKIFKYDFLYLTKMACTTKDPLFQINSYVNRASIVRNPLAMGLYPLGFNPDLLYISDMYYAHFCNEIAPQLSISSGWNYYMKSLTFYQHGDIRPNDTGGYVDADDRTYGEIVEQKHLQAIDIAFGFYNDIKSGESALTREDLNDLFKAIHNECNYNYNKIRNRVLNYKSYK